MRGTLIDCTSKSRDGFSLNVISVPCYSRSPVTLWRELRARLFPGRRWLCLIAGVKAAVRRFEILESSAAAWDGGRSAVEPDCEGVDRRVVQVAGARSERQ